MKEFFKKQFTFALYGFVFWFPVMLVIYIVIFLLSNAEKAGKLILGNIVINKGLYSVLAIILAVLIVYLSGVILKLTKVGDILSKIPVIGLFFGRGEVMSIDRLGRHQPCMFLFSPTAMGYGWILSEEKVKIGAKQAPFSLVNVYFPGVPTLVAGSIHAVRKESVMKLGNSSREMIDVLLYNIRTPSFIEFLPWEDETPEQFEERSKLFGVKDIRLPYDRK
jgi:uncharacterized membrane protein